MSGRSLGIRRQPFCQVRLYALAQQDGTARDRLRITGSAWSTPAGGTAVVGVLAGPAGHRVIIAPGFNRGHMTREFVTGGGLVATVNVGF